MRAIRDKAAGNIYQGGSYHLYADDSEKSLCGRPVPKRAATLKAEIDPLTTDRVRVCRSCKKKADPEPTVKLSLAEMKALHARAVEAADAAFTAASPRPMVVGTPKNMMASLMGQDDGGLDPEQPIYHVPDGVCGFAWVTVYPGNSRFANFLRREAGASTGYRGGCETWDYSTLARSSQSYERKMAAADAYAAVLREAGLTAYSNGRLD